MSKFFKIGIVTLLVAGALAVALSGTVLAQDETPAPKPEPFFRHPFSRNLGGPVGLEAAAEVLGMTVDELETQLWGGRSMADLADEAGVELKDLRDAVEDARLDLVRERIEQAVEDGKLSREKADWLLEGLDQGFLGGPGVGGFLGPRGHGRHFGPSRFHGRGGRGGFGGTPDGTGFGGFERFQRNGNAISGTDS